MALDTSAIVTVTNPGDTLAISGAISGSGGLTTGGAGTLVISGNLSINGGVTASGAGTVLISGPISGSGGVTVSGPGTLVLGASNTYSGGTTIIAGTLEGNTASLKGAIADNAALVFNQTSAGTFSGSISGSGSLGVTGGSFTLQAADTAIARRNPVALGDSVLPFGLATAVKASRFRPGHPASGRAD